MRLTSKKLLQCAVAIGGCVPVGAGLAGIVLGPSMIDGALTPIPLDSHFRYLSGLLLGIGFGFWSCIPHIEKHTKRAQLLGVIVFIGGLGRVTSLWAAGAPDKPMQLAFIMELVITPLLVLWQYRISKA